MTFPPLIIWAKALFFFEQLFPVVARTWFARRSECLFFGPKFRFLVQKSDFCHTTPILVDDPFLALSMTVNFPTWKPFFDFPFRSYSCFRKNIWLTAQKVFPPPTVGAPSASNSPSALSPRALRAGWIKIILILNASSIYHIFVLATLTIIIRTIKFTIVAKRIAIITSRYKLLS